MKTESGQWRNTNRDCSSPNVPQPTPINGENEAGDGVGSITLPPISSFIGSETPKGSQIETQSGSPMILNKPSQSVAVLSGPDISFFDRDIQLKDIATDEDELKSPCNKESLHQIPKDRMLLPDTLSKDAINFLYFHHFINHTSKLLVTHDCLNNPFKTILPQSEHSLLQISFCSSRNSSDAYAH